MPPICPTVGLRLPGTAGSVKTRVKDLNLHVCELSGISGNRPEPLEWRMLWALRCFGDHPDRICRGSAVAGLLGSWPIRAVPVPIDRRRLGGGGGGEGGAHAP